MILHKTTPSRGTTATHSPPYQTKPSPRPTKFSHLYMISWQLLFGNWTNWYFGKRKFNRILTPLCYSEYPCFLKFPRESNKLSFQVVFPVLLSLQKRVSLGRTFLEPKILVSGENSKNPVVMVTCRAPEFLCSSSGAIRANETYHFMSYNVVQQDWSKERVKINNKFTNDISPMSSLTCWGQRNPTTSLL